MVNPILQAAFDRSLDVFDHRPDAMPAGPWVMRQRWNDLLFAHWPIPAAVMAALLPASLEVDTFDGFAWVGVVPFWMDAVHNRLRFRKAVTPTIAVPTTRSFPELNLRTYVRSPRSGKRGVFFFSLDCASPLAVFGARTLFHLPYFLARMQRVATPDGLTSYASQRLFRRAPVRFDATFRSLIRNSPNDAAERSGPSQDGSIEHFLTERYCLFTPFGSRMLVGDIHHLPWTLEPAEAEIRVNEIPAAHGITLPNRPPILHFARELHVSIWPLRDDVA